MLKDQERTEKTRKTPYISHQQSLSKAIDEGNCLFAFQRLTQVRGAQHLAHGPFFLGFGCKKWRLMEPLCEPGVDV